MVFLRQMMCTKEEAKQLYGIGVSNVIYDLNFVRLKWMLCCCRPSSLHVVHYFVSFFHCETFSFYIFFFIHFTFFSVSIFFISDTRMAEWQINASNTLKLRTRCVYVLLWCYTILLLFDVDTESKKKKIMPIEYIIQYIFVRVIQTKQNKRNK